MVARIREPIPLCVEITTMWQNGDSIIENTMHYRMSEQLTPADALDIASNWQNFLFTAVAPNVSNTYTCFAIRVADMLVPTVVSLDYGEFTHFAGTDTNAALPAQVAATIRFKTGLAGKSHRGRWVMFGLTEVDTVNNDLATVYAGNLGVMAGNILGERASSKITEAVIASPTHGIMTTVTTYVVVPYTTTMERRAKGVGR